MIPRTLLSFLLLTLMIGAAQGAKTRSQLLRATSPPRRTPYTATVRRKPERTPDSRKLPRQSVILPKGRKDHTSLEVLDDPVERFERLINAGQVRGKDLIGSFDSPRYQNWMSELRWAEDALYVLLPMSIIDLRHIAVTHFTLKSLPGRESALSALFRDAQGPEKRKGKGKSPPFPFNTQDIKHIRKSHERYRQGRMILPAISNADSEGTRILPAYTARICSREASFDPLLPNGYHISVVAMVALRRINVWIKEATDLEKREARKAEGRRFRTFILAYVNCYREAVQWEIDMNGMKVWKVFLQVDELLDALEKATKIDADASEITEALGSIRPVTAKETGMIGKYGTQHDLLLNEDIGSDTEAAAWKRWTELLKVTFTALDKHTAKRERERPLFTKMKPVPTVTSSLSPKGRIGRSVAGDGVCAHIQFLLDKMEPHLTKFMEESKPTHYYPFLNFIPRLKDLLPLLQFRSMQAHPLHGIGMTWYVADEWMQSDLASWESALDKIKELMVAKDMKNTHTIFTGIRRRLLDFCSPEHVSQEEARLALYSGHQEGLTAEESRFNHPLEVWRSRIFAAVLGEVVFDMFGEVSGSYGQLSLLSGSKVRVLMEPVIGKASRMKSLVALDMFLKKSILEKKSAPFKGSLSEGGEERNYLASATCEFIEKKIWKSPRTEKSEGLFNWIIGLLRHVDDVIKEVRERIK